MVIKHGTHDKIGIADMLNTNHITTPHVNTTPHSCMSDHLQNQAAHNLFKENSRTMQRDRLLQCESQLESKKTKEMSGSAELHEHVQFKYLYWSLLCINAFFPLFNSFINWPQVNIVHVGSLIS